MKGLKKLQAEQFEWSIKNFGWSQPTWMSLLGIQEEVGELSHAYLKREQGIRGTSEEHDAEIRDAVGDIVIFLMDFCSRSSLDLADILEETWSRVKERDWTKDAESGGE